MISSVKQLLSNMFYWIYNLIFLCSKLYWKPITLIIISSFFYRLLGGVAVSKYEPIPPMTTYQNILLTIFFLFKGFCILWMTVSTFLYRHRNEYYFNYKND